MKPLEYILSKMGAPSHVRKQWKNYPCPYHLGDGAHFGINVKQNRFYCFVCQEAGNLGKLYQDIKKGIISPIFNKTKNKFWYDEVRKKIPSPSPFISDEALENIKRWSKQEEDISRKFKREYTHIMEFEESKLKKDGIAYLNKRGVNPATTDVGFLEEYSGRVIFPFRLGDKVVYYQGRSFYDIPIKTINPSEEKGWLPKTQVLYNYNFLFGKDIVITEGVFDYYSVYKYTGMAGTCLLGKNISSAQMLMLKKLKVKSIVVFLDSDAVKEAIKLGIRLYENNFNVKVVLWQNINKKLDPNNLRSSFINRLISDAKEINYYSSITLLPEYS